MKNGRLRVLKYYIISRVSDCTLENANKFYMSSKLKKALLLLKEILLHTLAVLKIMFRNYNFIYHMDMVVTTKCSLKCRDCSNLMQYYGSPYNISLDKNINSLEKLSQAIDEIGTLTILGGEPLLYPYLAQVLEKAISIKKIQKVRLISNGTILPPPPR